MKSTRLAALLMMCVLAGACSGPFIWLPGGKLEGPESALNAADLPPEGGVMQLETNPADPYSVNVGFQLIEGRIFIDPAEERRWYQHLSANPQVRIRFEGEEKILTAMAVPVTEEAVLAQFDPTRIVLEIVPR